MGHACRTPGRDLERAVDEGLVRSIGLSNFSPEKTEKWLKDARIKPAVNQVHTPPPPHHEISKYYQSTGKARTRLLQSLLVLHLALICLCIPALADCAALPLLLL